jgi:hypothetical protein
MDFQSVRTVTVSVGAASGIIHIPTRCIRRIAPLEVSVSDEEKARKGFP